MRIEALILGQDDGPLESGGDILQGKPIAAPYWEIGAYAFDQRARAIQHLDIRSHCVGFDLVVRRRLREGRCRSRQGKQRTSHDGLHRRKAYLQGCIVSGSNRSAPRPAPKTRPGEVTRRTHRADTWLRCELAEN